jgi:hypothetical protein
MAERYERVADGVAARRVHTPVHTAFVLDGFSRRRMGRCGLDDRQAAPKEPCGSPNIGLCT